MKSISVPVVKPYQMKWLKLGAESNSNNARVPAYLGKGYCECLESGWIIEVIHPHGNYKYFEITEAGSIAAQTKVSKAVTVNRRLIALPPRIVEMPQRIFPLK